MAVNMIYELAFGNWKLFTVLLPAFASHTYSTDHVMGKFDSVIVQAGLM